MPGHGTGEVHSLLNGYLVGSEIMDTKPRLCLLRAEQALGARYDMRHLG